MNGMTGGVEVFWTLLICNYIKFNHIPRDVELVIFHWLSCCFFLDADIGHGDPNSQFRPVVKAYVLGPLTYQQQLAVRVNLTHRLFALLGAPGLGVIFDMFGFLRCWLGSIWDRLCLYWFFWLAQCFSCFRSENMTAAHKLCIWQYGFTNWPHLTSILPKWSNLSKLFGVVKPGRHMGALVAFTEVQGGCSIPRVVNFIRSRILVHSYKMYPMVRFSECQIIPVGSGSSTSVRRR